MLLLTWRISLQLQNQMKNRKSSTRDLIMRKKGMKGSYFKEETIKSEISRHWSMRGLYFRQTENVQFLKDR